jgi:hypothetical protein
MYVLNVHNDSCWYDIKIPNNITSTYKDPVFDDICLGPGQLCGVEVSYGMALLVLLEILNIIFTRV